MRFDYQVIIIFLIEFTSMMAEKNISQISWLSQQIEIDPLNKSNIIGRSDAYVLEGKYDEAISDISKAILLEPSREHLVKRSKLLREKGEYSLAIQDLADARTLAKDSNEITAADIYLQTSVCMRNLKEVSEMANLVEETREKTNPKPYIKTLEELLHIQDMKFAEQAHERSQQIQNLKLHYQEQSKLLKDFFINQLNELKQKINETVQNYEEKFLMQLQAIPLEHLQKIKLRLYFQTFSSEMEKYYIAAKNLKKIEDKSLRFQDFEGMIIYKARNEIMKKLYLFFDKYSSHIEKIVSIIQNIPYIGSTFCAIKTAMKARGWVQDANMENQCINIEKIAINTTSFNELATNVAYFATFHFQTSILGVHPKYKSQWQQLLDRIKTLKREQLGVGKYKHESNEELDTIKDYATIHASILMVGIACNCLTINKVMLKQPNQAHQKKQETLPYLSQVYKLIQQTQAILRKDEQEITPSDKSDKGYCEIY